MDTEKCRALIYAINEGSITAAADMLGYTVSGISKMIASLEKETGLPLLLRGKKGVIPTEECIELLPYMLRLTDDADTFLQTAGELKGIHRGHICVGTSYQGYLKDLALAVSKFHDIYPDIKVELVSSTSSRLREMLSQGKTDLCLVSLREGYDSFTPIANDEIMAWLPQSSEFEEMSELPLNLIGELPYISIYAQEETDNSIVLKRLGITIKATYETAGVYPALSLVEAGLGFALINRLLAEEIGGNVITLPLSPRQLITVGLGHRETISPAARKLKDFLLEVLKK